MTPKTTPKDFFLHLGATIALYVAAGALINLAFSIINYEFPDALAGYFYPNSVAWPISILIILVPILYVLEWLINRDIVQMPEKKDIWIRRWRIYLTIFLTIALIGGDLIALINTYLNGEITARFAWKVIAVLLVAGAIGKYYFFSMYENWKHAGLFRKGNAWFGIILVVAAIIGGFLIVGSPATQRALRFDQQRTSDLQNIQWQIVNYWQQKGTLPPNLGAIADPISGFSIPADPETGAAYEYGIIGTTTPKGPGGVNISFQLCATFDRASRDLKGKGTSNVGSGVTYPTMDVYMYPDSGSWDHTAGHDCFNRAIDPSRYPVNQFKVPQAQ